MSFFSEDGLLLAVLVGNSVSAQSLESSISRLTGERPDGPGTATVVAVGVYLLDIDEIDDAGQRFSIDMFLRIEWQDRRLALPEDQRSGQPRTLPLDQIWTPRGLVVNDRGLSIQLPSVASVDAEGHVTYRQRLSGELAADLDFGEFPFDVQVLPIEIVSYQYSPDEVRLSSSAFTSGGETSFSIEGWQLRILDAEVGELTIRDEGIVRPRVTYFIEAKRNATYYLLTMALPMSLIVFMAWTALWLQPTIVNPRLGISTASIFSLIALGISIRLRLPPVSYLTRADVFVIGCTILIFGSLGITVISSRWATDDRMQQALRLNAAARWVFVAVFAVIATTALAF